MQKGILIREKVFFFSGNQKKKRKKKEIDVINCSWENNCVEHFLNLGKYTDDVFKTYPLLQLPPAPSPCHC